MLICTNFTSACHTKKLFVPHGKNSLNWGDIFIMKNTAVKKISYANLTIRRIKTNKVRTFFLKSAQSFICTISWGRCPSGPSFPLAFELSGERCHLHLEPDVYAVAELFQAVFGEDAEKVVAFALRQIVHGRAVHYLLQELEAVGALRQLVVDV